MSGSVGQRELFTQKRVLAFLQDALGYTYLGHWKDREGNANVEEELLTEWLKRQGHRFPGRSTTATTGRSRWSSGTPLPETGHGP
jgi:type I restriction enzyme R subunit